MVFRAFTGMLSRVMGSLPNGDVNPPGWHFPMNEASHSKIRCVPVAVCLCGARGTRSGGPLPGYTASSFLRKLVNGNLQNGVFRGFATVSNATNRKHKKMLHLYYRLVF